MKIKKVALCLSGLIGSDRKFGEGKYINYHLTKDYFDKNINDDLVEIDYFLHCWNTDLEKKINKLYKPKKSIFEPPLEKEQNISSKQYSLISSHYSKKSVVKLKRKFEQSKGFIYDIVILTRFDILIKKKLDYNELKKDKFYVVGPEKHHLFGCKCEFCDKNHIKHSLNDLIFISNSKNIDIFSKLYDGLNGYGLNCSHHVVTKKHLLKTNLYKDIDYYFFLRYNKYQIVWKILEYLNIFPRGIVPVRIYETNVPLTRWVVKPFYLKILDFIIFKLKIDILVELLFYPLRLIKRLIKK